MSLTTEEKMIILEDENAYLSSEVNRLHLLVDSYSVAIMELLDKIEYLTRKDNKDETE